MAEESTQKKLNRIRPPRVQITYDVETGGAIQKTELPLVVGILADLAGNDADPDKKALPLKERKFVEIDRDNFNEVMKSIGPRVKLTFAPGTPPVELLFEKFDDLRPEAIVKNVESLNKLFEARQKLNDLVAKLDGNDKLDTLLKQVVALSADDQQALKKQLEGGN